MSLFNILGGEFIEIIEWTDDSRDTMVYRFPTVGNAIKYGAKLTVREGQAAVFVHEGQLAAGQAEVVNLVRCVWAGSQRYGALAWSGDIHSTFADLRAQIIASIHMGIAGIPWFTTDIGGFNGGNIADPAFHELLVRWFQFGTFSPVMRMHGNRLPFEDITDRKSVV